MAKNFNFQILRLEGFVLNPEDKVVNGVLKGLKRCNGQCPCYHAQEGEEISEEDLMCPCKEYRENKHCRCNLYIRQWDYKKECSRLLKEQEDLREKYEKTMLALDDSQRLLNDTIKERDLIYESLLSSLLKDKNVKTNIPTTLVY